MVALELEPGIAVERFRSSRRKLRERAVGHAEGDIDDADVERLIAGAATAVAKIARRGPGVIGVRVDGSPDAAYMAMMAAIAEASPRHGSR